MKVWWCEEHRNIGGETRCQHGLGDRFASVMPSEPCRMVEMQLAPLDARLAIGDDLLIHRDTDGNWPLSIIDALIMEGFDGWAVQEIIERELT